MIFSKEDKPSNFKPKFVSVGAYLERAGEILLLQRSPTARICPLLFGVPGGKLNPGEKIVKGLVREIEEETGKKFRQKDMEFIKTFYVRIPELGFDFDYHVFKAVLPEQFVPTLAPAEHVAFRWITPFDALATLPLMPDEELCMAEVYDFDLDEIGRNQIC